VLIRVLQFEHPALAISQIQDRYTKVVQQHLNQAAADVVVVPDKIAKDRLP
jgi:hypothetical protein